MQNNKGLFDFLYGNRNGGAYLNVMRALWEVGPGKLLARSPEILAMVPDLKRYISGRKHIVDSVSRGVPHGGVPSYDVLSKVFNIVVSPSLLEDRVYVDATNDDIFACWDMDGLNNDFLGYKMLFDRNMHNLCAIMPFADKVYVVDEAMARAGEGGGVMTARRFSGKYDKLAILAAVHLNDPAFLRQAGIDDDTIDRMRELHLDQRLMDREVPEQGMVQDIEAHLKGFYLPALSVDEAKYLHFS
ncbi:hypothetical protein KY362_00900 [Candidatus Woesearchaeota archaeon]|nr:hypothetical protein [Candidatus Woesearchaeota archaeon]